MNSVATTPQLAARGTDSSLALDLPSRLRALFDSFREARQSSVPEAGLPEAFLPELALLLSELRQSLMPPALPESSRTPPQELRLTQFFADLRHSLMASTALNAADLAAAEPHDESISLTSQLQRLFEGLVSRSPYMLPAHSVENLKGRLDGFFSDLQHGLREYHDWRRRGEEINVWQAAGFGRDEIRVTRTLAWFLDQKAEHGHGEELLRRLLVRLSVTHPQATETPKATDVASDYQTIVESCPSGDKESRVDIEISGQMLLVFVEAKIDAGETGNQLDRYLKIGERLHGNRRWGVIFLTPFDEDSQNVSETRRDDRKLLYLSWREVSEEFHRYAIELEESFARTLILQFAGLVKTFKKRKRRNHGQISSGRIDHSKRGDV